MDRPLSLEKLAGALTEAQRRALLTCYSSSLGAVIPATDDDARILSDAGLAWTDKHWWRQLNADGLALRQHLQNGGGE